MTEETQVRTLTFEEKEYQIDKLEDKSKTIINLIGLTDTKLIGLRGEIAITESAKLKLMDELRESLKSYDEKE